MTYESAMRKLRRKCRKDSAIKAVFAAICENRYSHPVRDWAIFDLCRDKGWGCAYAQDEYSRHLAHLYEIFAVPVPLELQKTLNDTKNGQLEK